MKSTKLYDEELDLFFNYCNIRWRLIARKEVGNVNVNINININVYINVNMYVNININININIYININIFYLNNQKHFLIFDNLIIY